VESAEEGIRVLEYRSQAARARRKIKTSHLQFSDFSDVFAESGRARLP